MNKVELIGREYIMDYCFEMAKRDRDREIFEVYVSDGLKALLEGFSHVFGGQHLSKRYYDILHPPKPVKEEPKEIIDRIKNKIRGIRE